jgi:hypothetical protein
MANPFDTLARRSFVDVEAATVAHYLLSLVDLVDGEDYVQVT